MKLRINNKVVFIYLNKIEEEFYIIPSFSFKWFSQENNFLIREFKFKIFIFEIVIGIFRDLKY